MGGNCSSSTTGSDPNKEQQHQHQNQHENEQKQTIQETEKSPDNKSTNDGMRSVSHYKCRNGLYAGVADVRRCDVPDDKVAWNVTFEGYQPIEFFAVQPVPIPEDEDIRKVKVDVCWNAIDGKVNRRSHQGDYEIHDSVPRNPVGRTGIIGRGKLARWGPNHAADPVVTRWKRDNEGGKVMGEKTGKPILQFITIQRGDTKDWAIPGGFVDDGEEVNKALKREFCEEAMDSTQLTEEEKANIVEKLDRLFSNGTEIYKGYVDDPRNTDNSWMETVVLNFHDDDASLVDKLNLKAGDDAIGVQWQDMSSTLELYASHAAFIQQVAQQRNCDW